ncbi:hypothetical protein HGRIS_008261 [Hohenbuehelia grisea]|uniref:Spindle pole body component n=1 Tax=Hohenbuehelia grisea TaxID=104357 RepID=A0ABR3J7H1_9AGAR
MIAEIFLILAGHSSSLFTKDNTIDPAFIPLLHPGEQQTLESLAQVAARYRRIRTACATLAHSPSRYVCAICATLRQILTEEYETVVVQTEAKVLRRDPELVASGSFVPLATIRAVFSEWDAPLAALVSFVGELEAEKNWRPGPLIDMVTARSHTGVHRVAQIFTRLAHAAQRVWRTQVCAFIIHGSLSSTDPLASETYALLEGSMPSCVSAQSRESIAYVGRAIATVKAAKWQKQLPRSLALQHTTELESVLPEDQHLFDSVISQIRINVSEWLWMNVLTRKDVEDAVDSLANYFLLRNGEFSLSLIREIERLKLSRLKIRSGSSSMIREQDLNLAILRASLGTFAQHDPSLSHLRFTLPSGPLRPLLPSLTTGTGSGALASTTNDATQFSDLLLGTPLVLQYTVSWPLDLFLHETDLQAYGELNAFLSSLRKTHTQVHTCWTSLSNAQRARRRWTGLGEGGTQEDLEARRGLLRCGWGAVRDMEWFLDSLLGYVMMDVVDAEFSRLKATLGKEGLAQGSSSSRLSGLSDIRSSTLFTSGKSLASVASDASHLDFTTLRSIHASYLDRLLTGCLLTNPNVTAILRSIFEVCERFVAQVERWGGDVLPALLFEGSLHSGDQEVGGMVRERWSTVREINDTLHSLLESFYEQLSLSASHQPYTTTDASKSILMNTSMANLTVNASKLGGPKGLLDAAAEVRRHVERLLLRLDFNGSFSQHKSRQTTAGIGILREGGLA